MNTLLLVQLIKAPNCLLHSEDLCPSLQGYSLYCLNTTEGISVGSQLDTLLQKCLLLQPLQSYDRILAVQYTTGINKMRKASHKSFIQF